MFNVENEQTTNVQVLLNMERWPLYLGRWKFATLYKNTLRLPEGNDGVVEYWLFLGSTDIGLGFKTPAWWKELKDALE